MLSFSDLGVGENVLKAIEELGFVTPTPIQEQAIPRLLADETDFIGLAQTGTGKTAAFGLPLLSLTDLRLPTTQALILAPTRELCVQITNDLVKYGKYERSASITPVYGGANIVAQIRQIKKGSQIVVATPGRLIDLINRGAIRMDQIRYVVLDEADEMLNMGFQEDIDEILSHLPKQRRVWLFSATMPQEVRTIASKYMHEPFELTIGRKNEGAGNIEHYYYVIHEKDRYQGLKRLLDSVPEIFGIIFCRTKIDTQRIAENLAKDGYNSDSLHGDLTQTQRDKVMARYRSKNLDVLVATDVAARGIDVNDITHVIHYNLPDEPESYTHRSGRTARAGKSGISIALVNTREIDKIRFIEKKINTKFHLGKIPDAVQICEMQLMNLMHKINEVKVNEGGIAKYLAPVFEELKDLSKEDLIKRVVSIEFNRFLDAYRNAPDLNVDLAHSGKGSSGYRSSAPRMFINLGSMDGLNEKMMRKYVSEILTIEEATIGRIDVKGVYSFVEMQEKDLNRAMETFQGEIYQGRKVRIEVSSPETRKKPGEFRGGSGGGGGRKYSGGGAKSYGSSSKGKYSSDRGDRGGGSERSSGSSSGSGGKRGWGENRPAKKEGSGSFKKKKW
ncbi:MAG: DEAD/DEAH box helicase [Bacteroidetes bacterium]|nr:DEAD/DEAH box helicase [Bacteroidota bacterium]